MDGEYVQAVVKVGAKCSGPDRIAQVAIGCGDDARAAFACRGFADALIFAILQHPQQFGLEFQRQLADLVEEQRAVGGIFKKTGLRAGRAGEGSFAVAEQGGLDQRGGDRGAVEHLERRFGFAPSFCIAVATSSLPLPDSPSMSTGKGMVAYITIWLRRALSRGFVRRCREVCPSRDVLGAASHPAACWTFSASSRYCLIFSGAQGLAMKSIAPNARAWRALLCSSCPDRTKILIFGRVRQQFGDQVKAFIRAVRRGRQAQIDQRQLGRGGQFAQ